jgi:hypothetical protein
MKLIRYMMHIKTRDKLPRIPRQYSVEYQPEDIDQDTARLFGLTATRSRQGVEILKRRYHTKDAHELVFIIPIQRPRRHAVIMPMLRRWFGTTVYDPMKRWAARAKGKRV